MGAFRGFNVAVVAGIPSILSILSSTPTGIDAAAARSNAELNEPRRKLPETPIIVVITYLPESLLSPCRSHSRSLELHVRWTNIPGKYCRLP